MAASDSTIITSLCWVSRGFAKQIVEDYQPNPEDMHIYTELTKKLDNK
jgi:hypothetical protein